MSKANDENKPVEKSTEKKEITKKPKASPEQIKAEKAEKLKAEKAAAKAGISLK